MPQLSPCNSARYRCFLLFATLFSLINALGLPVSAADPQTMYSRTIRVVMDNNYPPYTFVDDQGVIQGILVDRWRLWQQKTGIRVEITGKDWKDALNGMRAGAFDVIDTIFKTEERSDWLDFSQPYSRIEVATFFNDEISGINDIPSLKGFVVAAKEGDAVVDLLRRQGIDNLILFKGYEAIIQAAKAHKVNVFVIDKPPALYFLYKYGMQQQYKVSPPINVGEFHRAVRKGNTGLLHEVETGFALISRQESERIEKKWSGSRLLNVVPVTGLLVSAGGLAVVILGLFYWNRMLRTAVKKRTAELERSEEALRESEARYRELVEKANSIILRMDREGRILFLNKFAQRFFGYAGNEVIGRNVVGTIVPETDSAGNDLRAMIVDIGLHPDQYAVNENENMRRDGTRIWIAWTNKPLYDSAGEVGELLCVGNDITDRKRAEEALRRERECLEFVIAGSRLGTWEWNVQNNETVFNEIWAQLLGYTLAELTPCTYETWARLVHPDDLPLAQGALIKCVQGEATDYDCEIRMRHKDGHWIWILDRGRIFTRDAKGNPLSMFGTHTDITAIKRAEEELQTSNDLLSLFIKHSPIYAFIKEVTPTASRTLKASDNYQEMIGMPVSAMLGKTMEELFPAAFAAKITADDWRVVSGGEILQLDEDFNGRNYTTIKFPIRLGGKNLLAGYTIDLTARRQAEEEKDKLQMQLTQARKMESIGRLAGGVAHDFNNMLGVILGHCELALNRLPPSHPLHAGLLNIRQAAERSADLTRQLLAFARKQTVAPKVLDLNETVTGMLDMLRRLVGEDIDLVWQPGADLGLIRIDPSQIDQILVNLVINARDAIGDHGKVVIETAAVTVDESSCSEQADTVPGDYALLAISDDGGGMDAEMLSHLFEPFFTTKELGKGTGLGLATIYGIIKQNNGFVHVDSEPGQGTTFRVYLPRQATRTAEVPTTEPAKPVVPGSETILLVEDEPLILDIVTTMLDVLGYTVLPAATPGEALRVAREHAGEIHLLMTDVVMPEMNGRVLAKNLLSLYPGLRCLFMSGYTADVIANHGVLDEGVHFLQKPFVLNVLAAKLREALGHAAE